MYRVHDLETTTGTRFKRKASFLDPNGCVVLDAYKDRGKEPVLTYFGNDVELKRYRMAPIPEDIKILVGMNYKFDLLHSWRHPETVAFFKRGGKIWDIQYAEYLIEGQTEASMMCSLDDLSAKYGGTLKPDVIKEFWNSGVNTYDIPEDVLCSYGIGDLNNTETVFIQQYRKARELGILQMIWNRMDGLCYTIECEYNGMHVDKEFGLVVAAELATEIKLLNERLFEYLPKDMPPEIGFKFTNRYHLSPLIFGGKIKYEKRTNILDEEGKQVYTQKEVTGYYLLTGELTVVPPNESDPLLYAYVANGKKAGEPKTKKLKVDDLEKPKSRMEDYVYKLMGMTKPLPEWASATEGLYSVSADVIELLGASTTLPFLKDIADLVKKQKDLGTYYYTIDDKGEEKGMLSLVDPIDSCVHGSLNVNNTVTGRLAHSNPNLGNIPRGDTSRVKEMFTSRFGVDGMMVEEDYSQLEVVVQAMLSGDENLIADVNNKVDMHCKRVAAKFKCTYEEALEWCKDENYFDYKIWKSRRTGAKGFSFQRAFGAGAPAIALATGMSIEDVEELIAAEELMYPGISLFNELVAEQVKLSARSTSIFERTPEGAGVQMMRGQYVGKTGARWTFRQWVAPPYLRKRGILASFSPTEMKNYPTQGTAAELVQVVMGKVWRYWLACDNFGGLSLLVNQVHDALYQDCHKSVYKEAAAQMKRIMEEADQYFLDSYDWDVKVKFSADAEAGLNLFNKKHIHFDN